MHGMLQVLRLIDSLGEVTGRKKLQKIVHILQSCGHDFPQHFGYLHYGPFSSDVAAEVDSLVTGQLIEEQGDGRRYEAYVYRPREAARKLLRECKQTDRPDWDTLATKLNEKPVADLEAISTILYLKASGFASEKLKSRFTELKPALKDRYAAALSEAEKLPVVN